MKHSKPVLSGKSLSLTCIDFSYCSLRSKQSFTKINLSEVKALDERRSLNGAVISACLSSSAIALFIFIWGSLLRDTLGPYLSQPSLPVDSEAADSGSLRVQ